MAPVYDCEDSIGDEVENMKIWSYENRMLLNMEKTYEMIVGAQVTTANTNENNRSRSHIFTSKQTEKIHYSFACHEKQL